MPKSAQNASAKPLFGDQQPRILTCPPARSSAGAECVELAASFGLELDPWQQLVLHHALGEQSNGNWSAGQIGLTVPRQCGKGSVLEARMLAALVLFKEPLTVYSAHEFSTALEMLRRLEMLIGSSDEYAHLIKRVTRSNGKEGIELTNGCRAAFRTRTKSGGRGLTGDVVLLDEAMILSWESLGALMPTLSARPNAQLWFVGSAVDQQIHANGAVFSSVRRRGIEGDDPSLMYAEWSAEDTDDPADPRTWAKANPGMGYRISVDSISAEHRALRHSPKTFSVERLGIGDWADLIADEHQPVIPDDVWGALAVDEDEQPVLVGPSTLALDRTPDGATWTLAAARRTQSGSVHVEVGFHGPATNHEALAKILACVGVLDPHVLVVDAKSAAAPLRPYIEEAGVEVTVSNASQFVDACGGFVDDVEASKVSHTSQAVLTAAVANGTRRELPAGGWAWSKKTTEPISPLVACTLSHWALLTFAPAMRTRRTAPPMTARPDERDVFLDMDKVRF